MEEQRRKLRMSLVIGGDEESESETDSMDEEVRRTKVYQYSFFPLNPATDLV